MSRASTSPAWSGPPSKPASPWFRDSATPSTPLAPRLRSTPRYAASIIPSTESPPGRPEKLVVAPLAHSVQPVPPPDCSPPRESASRPLVMALRPPGRLPRLQAPPPCVPKMPAFVVSDAGPPASGPPTSRPPARRSPAIANGSRSNPPPGAAVPERREAASKRDPIASTACVATVRPIPARLNSSGATSSSASVNAALRTTRPAAVPDRSIVSSPSTRTSSVGLSVNVAVPLVRPAAIVTEKSGVSS